MILFPNAKVNLGLNITGKREDGFHDIETCFLPVGLTDILEFIKISGKTNITFSGINIPGSINDNLCLRAWHILNEKYEIPSVKIHLHKVIPIGAGLGGGSSDAAFMLKGLNEYFSLNMSTNKLLKTAAQLGSDCSFFILNKPCLARGKGDILKPSSPDLAAYKIVIINPGIHVSTSEAYAGVIPSKPLFNINDNLKESPENWRNKIINDFEKNVFKTHREIGKIKNKLYDLGAVYASMSGSGSSVYALFERQAPCDIISEFKDCFTWIQK